LEKPRNFIISLSNINIVNMNIQDNKDIPNISRIYKITNLMNNLIKESLRRKTDIRTPFEGYYWMYNKI